MYIKTTTFPAKIVVYNMKYELIYQNAIILWENRECVGQWDHVPLGCESDVGTKMRVLLCPAKQIKWVMVKDW